MWRLLIGAVGGILVIGAVYLVRRIHRFSFLQKYGEKHRVLSWLAAILLSSSLGLFAFINVPTMAVIALHLIIAFLLCDLLAWIAGKITGRKISKEISGITAILLCTVYLGVGGILAWHIFETDYSFETAKETGGEIRIVGIADSHLGVTLDGQRFTEQMERIRKLEPDIVLVAGDFVDGNSGRKDMIESCRALGSLCPESEVFFVPGNHDDDSSYRDFTPAELREALSENGVRVLEDEAVLVDHRFYVIGRKDRFTAGRADMKTLINGLDPSRYMIVIDHQPNDYAAEAEAGADLVFSGHTHGGHVFPAGLIGLLIGANDRLYGTETRGNTVFVVTSGISGWSIPIKTGTFSEITVIDIKAEHDR